MRHPSPLPFALLALCGLCAPAFAEGVPDHFVPSDQCTSRPCDCEDAAMVERFLNDQQAARDAWSSVKTDILSGTGPKTGADAIALFRSRFSGSQSIADQFKSCAGYDPSVNKLTKIAGVSPFGSAMVDPCFCDAFCTDIVQSTIAHESMHTPTIIAGVLGKGDVLVGCALKILSGPICDAVIPLTLTDSEILSHDAGIMVLRSALDRLQNGPSADTSTECTWDEIARSAPAKVPQPPAGLFDRLWLLTERLARGATP